MLTAAPSAPADTLRKQSRLVIGFIRRLSLPHGTKASPGRSDVAHPAIDQKFAPDSKCKFVRGRKDDGVSLIDRLEVGDPGVNEEDIQGSELPPQRFRNGLLAGGVARGGRNDPHAAAKGRLSVRQRLLHHPRQSGRRVRLLQETRKALIFEQAQAFRLAVAARHDDGEVRTDSAQP